MYRTRTRFGSHIFAVAALIICNSFRSSVSLCSFLRHLKTFSFNLAHCSAPFQRLRFSESLADIVRCTNFYYIFT